MSWRARKHDTSRRSVSLLMLVVLLLATVSAFVNGKRLLAHAIDHDRAPALSWSSHGHALVMAAAAATESQSLSAIEHKLLHDTGHQQTPTLCETEQPALPVVASSAGVPHAVSLPRSTKPEQPFRPPRTVATA